MLVGVLLVLLVVLVVGSILLSLTWRVLVIVLGVVLALWILGVAGF